MNFHLYILVRVLTAKTKRCNSLLRGRGGTSDKMVEGGNEGWSERGGLEVGSNYIHKQRCKLANIWKITPKRKITCQHLENLFSLSNHQHKNNIIKDIDQKFLYIEFHLLDFHIQLLFNKRKTSLFRIGNQLKKIIC